MKLVRFSSWVFKNDNEKFSDLKKIYPIRFQRNKNIFRGIIRMYNMINSNKNRKYLISNRFLNEKIPKSRLDINFYIDLYENLYPIILNNKKKTKLKLKSKYIKLTKNNVKVYNNTTNKIKTIKRKNIFIHGVYIEDNNISCVIFYDTNENIFYEKINEIIKFKLLNDKIPLSVFKIDEKIDKIQFPKNKNYIFDTNLSQMYINNIFNIQTNEESFVKYSLAIDNYIDNPIFYKLYIIVESKIFISLDIYLKVEILLNVIDLLENMFDYFDDISKKMKMNLDIYTILIIAWLLNKYIHNEIFVNKDSDVYKSYISLLDKNGIKIKTVLDFKFRFLIFIYETLFENDYINAKIYYKTSNKLNSIVKYISNIISSYSIKKIKNYFTQNLKIIPLDNNTPFTKYNRFKRKIDDKIYENFISPSSTSKIKFDNIIFEDKKLYPEINKKIFYTNKFETFSNINELNKKKIIYNKTFKEIKIMDDSLEIINKLFDKLKPKIKNIDYLIKYGELKNRMKNTTDKIYIYKLNRFRLFYKNILKKIWIYINNIKGEFSKKTLFSLLLDEKNNKKILDFLKENENMKRYDISPSIFQREKKIKHELNQLRFETYFNLTPRQKLIIDKIKSKTIRNQILDAINNMSIASDLLSENYEPIDEDEEIVIDYPDAPSTPSNT